MNNKLRWAWLVIALLVITSFSAYILIPDDWEYKEKVTNHVYDFNSLLAVLAVLSAVISIDKKDERRHCWFFMLLGVIGWLIGDLVWTVFIYLGIDPSPSLADVFYILGYVGIFAGIFSKYLHIRKDATSKDTFNGFFIGGSLLMIIGYVVLLPIALSDYDIIAKIVLLFYPIADAIIILFAVIILSTMGFDKESLPWYGVCAGIALWIVADTLAAYYDWGSIDTWFVTANDAIFIVGLHCIGIGAFYRKLVAQDEVGESNRPRTSLSIHASAS